MISMVFFAGMVVSTRVVWVSFEFAECLHTGRDISSSEILKPET